MTHILRMLRGAWHELRNRNRQTLDGCAARSQCGGTPVFEHLEPRLLLDAHMPGLELIGPLQGDNTTPAIEADLNQQGGPAPYEPGSEVEANLTEKSSCAPAIVGLELVDRDPTRLEGQLVYLDFDGTDDVTYQGPVTVGPFDLPAFQAAGELVGQEQLIITQVVRELNQMFAGSGVLFTTEQPTIAKPHSTVFVGGDDSAFAGYGSFLGLAEKVDVGNKDRTDKAFVFTENFRTSQDEIQRYVTSIAQLIGHEVGHLLGYEHSEDVGGSQSASSTASPLLSVAAGVPQSVPYSQNFDAGKPTGSQGWQYYSDNEGRIEVVNGRLRMDSKVSGTYSLNEAILHVNLSVKTN
ncbi:MAG: hypothetical protein ACE5NM_03520, partial [Sedimentisphaerales bacterium]